MRLQLNIKNFLKDLNNKYIPNGNIRKHNLIKVFDFLEKCNLARIIDTNKVVIYYSRLIQPSSPLKKPLDDDDRREFKDYAELIAQFYCSRKEEVIKKISEEKQRSKQTTLFSFK